MKSEKKKVSYCSGFYYLNSNKKLLMWYKKLNVLKLLLLFFWKSENKGEKWYVAYQTPHCLCPTFRFTTMVIVVGSLPWQYTDLFFSIPFPTI
jgi:hypothetical protein